MSLARHLWQFVGFEVQFRHKLTHLGVKNCLLNHIYSCRLEKIFHPGFAVQVIPQYFGPKSQLSLALRHYKNFAPYFPYQMCSADCETDHQHKLMCSFGLDSKGLYGKPSGGIGSRNGQKSDVHCHCCQPNIDRLPQRR